MPVNPFFRGLLIALICSAGFYTGIAVILWLISGARAW